MTIIELLRNKTGGRATLFYGDYEIHVDNQGGLYFDPANIPQGVFTGHGWQIKYVKNYHVDDVIKVLCRLDPDVGELERTEWNSWCLSTARETVYGIARALDLNIILMEKINKEN